jgi:O-antigen biosynthesis protein
VLFMDDSKTYNYQAATSLAEVISSPRKFLMARRQNPGGRLTLADLQHGKGGGARPCPRYQRKESQCHLEGTRMRVCIATMDFVGPVKNGGIGTFYTALAEILSMAGHKVSVLYLTSDALEEELIDFWQQHYSCSGIEFVVPPPNQHQFHSDPVMAYSWQAYAWLKQQNFDWIHFPEMRGLGFFSALAKHQGAGFQNTTLCVGLHSPSVWHRHYNGEFALNYSDCAVEFMERRSVELADVCIALTDYLATWVQEQGWKLPEHSYVIPAPAPYSDVKGCGTRCTHNPRELVFFGRLESRKGVEIFCDAIDQLEQWQAGGFSVTFLGKIGLVQGEWANFFLRQRRRGWNCLSRVVDSLDTYAALKYLSSPHRLAVMPSVADNSPYVVIECLNLGLPFLAAAAGGIPELIAPVDRERVLFSPDSKSLAERMKAVLDSGISPGRPAFTAEEAKEEWLSLHSDQELRQGRRGSYVAGMNSPLITVCIPHRNRPLLLIQALRSLAAQHYANMEILIVDDGSDDLAAQELLASLECCKEPFSIKVLYQQQGGPAAARNFAAAHARGDLLLFLDDDNCMKPETVETMLRCLVFTEADIVTSGFEKHPAHDDEQIIGQVAFSGVDLIRNLYGNVLGDTFSLMRRRVFLELGGFEEGTSRLAEDWEFFTRAVFSGARLEAIPDPLLLYRSAGDCRSRVTDRFGSHCGLLQIYGDNWPRFLKDWASLAVGTEVAVPVTSGVAPSLSAKRRARQRFAQARSTVMNFNRTGGFGVIKDYKNMRLLGTSPCMRFVATNEDPCFLLPRLDFGESQLVFVRMLLSVPECIECRLFFRRHGDQYFNPNNSLAQHLDRSGGEIIFELDGESLTGHLRIDPGDCGGEYVIYSIEVRAE